MNKLLGAALVCGSFFLALASVEGGGDDAKKGKRGGGIGSILGKGNLEEMFKKLDTNNDNKLSRDEFLKAADAIPDADKAEKLRGFLGKIFDRVAVDGHITQESLKNLGKGRKKKTAD